MKYRVYNVWDKYELLFETTDKQMAIAYFEGVRKDNKVRAILIDGYLYDVKNGGEPVK